MGSLLCCCCGGFAAGIEQELAFAGGIGFALAITIMAGIREHIAFSDVPNPLRGAGITLLVAAILAMSFMGFAGMMR